MKTIVSFIVITLLYICAASVFAGNDKSLGGGIPKTLGGTKVVSKQIPANSIETNSINSTDNTAENCVLMSFRIDEIVPQKGFFSRKQKDFVWRGRSKPSGSQLLDSSAFVSTTNTANLITGDWVEGLSNGITKDGIMTNGTEQLPVYIWPEKIKKEHLKK